MSDDNFKIVIPDISSEEGLALCCGNKKIYMQSLRLFITNIPVTLAKMRDLLHQSDITEGALKKYTTSVHSIKGMCVYIGAEEAGKKAKELEIMSEAGDIKSVRENNENFSRQIEKIINNIQIWFNNNKDFTERLAAESHPERKNG